MMKIITIIISIISWCFSILKKGTPDEERLKYDRLLADAIRRGDSEEVARIREKWKHYSSLVLLVVGALLIMGCSMFTSHKDIPLTGGIIPYPLKTPAVYEDATGKLHQEDKPRWSISEEDLFNDTRNIAEKASESKVNATLTKAGGYIKDYTIYFIAVLLIYIVVKRKP